VIPVPQKGRIHVSSRVAAWGQKKRFKGGPCQFGFGQEKSGVGESQQRLPGPFSFSG